MRIGNLIKVAFKSIGKNRMRSALTMLGIIIGVGAVIIMVSIGTGTQVEIENQITSLGTNLLMVLPGSAESRGVRGGAGSLSTLTIRDVKKLESEATLLSYISPVIRSSRQAVSEGNNWQTSVNGVSPEYLEIRDWKVEDGAFFTERDVKTKKKVAVLGQTVKEELFGDVSPVGKKIRIGSVPFTVIGLMEKKGQSGMGNDEDDVILAPSTTVLYRMSDGETVHMIMASAASTETMDLAESEIETLLRTSHRLRSGEESDFHIRNQTDIIETASTITGFLTVLLGAIAGVSLFVGGIGIMNIMLVSVTERTREIGIRLAVGARSNDVLVQFLIEAVTLSLLGGIIGILFGIGFGKLIGMAAGLTVVTNPLIVFISFLFSGAVGIFFGFYPAKKASRMNPIDALHYE
ncbi:MAG: ABC transporter permease [Spirochaetes bacterium]|nr:ABC transporter permease [Spirochaetota bacterium]